MKKVIFLLGLFFLGGIAFESSAKVLTPKKTYTSFDKGRRTKSGRYKKKKGFMWGLFRGKNQCDCPKH